MKIRLVVFLLTFLSPYSSAVLADAKEDILGLLKKVAGMIGASDACGAQEDAKKGVKFYGQVVDAGIITGIFDESTRDYILELGKQESRETLRKWLEDHPFPCSKVADSLNELPLEVFNPLTIETLAKEYRNEVTQAPDLPQGHDAPRTPIEIGELVKLALNAQDGIGRLPWTFLADNNSVNWQTSGINTWTRVGFALLSVEGFVSDVLCKRTTPYLSGIKLLGNKFGANRVIIENMGCFGAETVSENCQERTNRFVESAHSFGLRLGRQCAFRSDGYDGQLYTVQDDDDRFLFMVVEEYSGSGGSSYTVSLIPGRESENDLIYHASSVCGLYYSKAVDDGGSLLNSDRLESDELEEQYSVTRDFSADPSKTCDISGDG